MVNNNPRQEQIPDPITLPHSKNKIINTTICFRGSWLLFREYQYLLKWTFSELPNRPWNLPQTEPSTSAGKSPNAGFILNEILPKAM